MARNYATLTNRNLTINIGTAEGLTFGVDENDLTLYNATQDLTRADCPAFCPANGTYAFQWTPTTTCPCDVARYTPGTASSMRTPPLSSKHVSSDQ